MKSNINQNPVKFFLLFFLATVPWLLNAQTPVELKKGDRLAVGKQVGYYIDSTNQLEINDILNKKFEIGNTDVLNLGPVTSNIWLRFSLLSKSEKEAYIEINAPLLNTLEIYEVVNGNANIIFKGGSKEVYSKRQILMENWLLHLDTESSEAKDIFIKGQSFYPFQLPLFVSTKDKFVEESKHHYLFWGIYIGVMILAFIYNLFIYFSVRESSYLYYLMSILFSSLFYLGLSGFGFWFFWPNTPSFNLLIPVLVTLSNLAGIKFAFNFLQITKSQKFLYYFGIVLSGFLIFCSILNLANNYEISFPLSQLLSLIVCLYLISLGVSSFRKGVVTAKYYLLAWTIFLILVIVYILTLNNIIPSTFFTIHSAYIGHMTEVALLSFALADRINLLKRENESKQLKIIEGLKVNETLQISLNQELESKVKDRTIELEAAIAHLKSTQDQLIHAEKMASFGALTAGVAHEIQNPLNFVNNFSDLNAELIDELQQELNIGNLDEAKSISKIIKENEQKITHHGKRADSIVKGMLQHSRTSAAEKEQTDINVLCDEYVKFAYLGYRAKDKDFKANYKTVFDQNIPKILVTRQDIGRVILNIFNNAFFAVYEKSKHGLPLYEPNVSITTSLSNKNVIIAIKDNGLGIPNEIIDRILEPFFTTKKGTEGTGLGLSITNDIIKAHGGELLIDSIEGEGSEFVIQLPISS